ncbi:ATP-binding cassette domain-containing protein [Trinickia soli]|uniref:ATP-binding cassette domain-containing protein n=1 Tax=Trinickia soli TaxID=380675 RepID=UPI003FA36243
MIELRQISQRFAGPNGWVEALHDINLSIPAGQIFGIIGRISAGKSTLVRTINLLARPSAGEVVVDGKVLNTLPAQALREARREIGMVFQHFNLLNSRTVFDNVALPLEPAGMKRAAIAATVLPLLELVGLTALKDRYPAHISGGQKQRVGIAREVDRGQIETAEALGASTRQIVFKVLWPEALPGIVAGLTITFVSLVGYSAMAGAIGGGGLGDLGIRYGYQRFLPEVMVTVVVILIVFVQLVQSFGDWLVRRLSHR